MTDGHNDDDDDKPTGRPVATGRLRRAARLGALGVRMAGHAAGAGARAVARRGQDRFFEQGAATLASRLAEMKGLPMKIGQILSYMDGVVPLEHQETWRKALAPLQQKAAPLDPAALEAVLERELGAPASELFASFDTRPVAAASIGQVFRAVTHDGTDVAVKIQYPGIADAVESDLKNIEGLLATVLAVLPDIDVHQAVADTADRIVEECDYRREAAHLEEFAALWRADGRMQFPRVIGDRSTVRVLTTTWLSGESFEQLRARADHEEKSAVGEVLFTFVFRSLLTNGLYNGDPHPGNFVFLSDGRVGFLDFGCVQRYPEPVRLRLRDVRDAVLAGARGADLYDHVAAALGMTRDLDPALRDVMTGYVEYCFEPALAEQPWRYHAGYTERLGELTFAMKKAMARHLRRAARIVPNEEGWVFLTRILFGLNSLLVALEAERDWRALLLDA